MADSGKKNTVSSDRAAQGKKTIENIYSSKQNARAASVSPNVANTGMKLPKSNVSDFKSNSTMSTSERVTRGSAKTAETSTRSMAGKLNTAGLVSPTKSATISLNGTFYDNPGLRKAKEIPHTARAANPGMLGRFKGASSSMTDYRSAGTISTASKKVLKSLRSHL